MAGAQQSSRETQRYIEKARSERHGPNALLGCKHPQKLEYALFFNYMMQSSVERNGEEWAAATPMLSQPCSLRAPR